MVVPKESNFRSGAAIQEELYSALPPKLLNELENLHGQLHYPGWEKDYNATHEAFQMGSELKFSRCFRKLRDKQRVYDDYKAFTRLNALAHLHLTYPGNEYDKQAVEKWHLEHPSTDETDIIFEDKLEGLRNKEQLFFGDRSHPNVQDLDALELSYVGWEADYQAAVAAHCDTPGKSFAAILHRLRQKQRLSEGNRSHWRLVELDKLELSYPGWEDDVAEVEEWHLRNPDNKKNNILYAEVIEGMKDQQQIYLGWDHDDDNVSSDESTNGNIEAEISVEKERNEVKEMAKCYESITSSLNCVEGMRKKILEERSTSSGQPCSRNGTPQRQQSTMARRDRGATLYREQGATSRRERENSPSPTSPTQRTSSVAVNIVQSRNDSPKQQQQPEQSSPPPKQANLGKCEVCCARPKTHVFIPCGHLCACAACSHQTMEDAGQCPICRTTAQHSFRVFLT